jgi:hypothetical protein
MTRIIDCIHFDTEKSSRTFIWQFSIPLADQKPRYQKQNILQC